jgi:hypothetical protein
MKQISCKEEQNEYDLQKYHEIKDSGLKHISDDLVDIKLSTALDDIQELKTNSSIFSKNLSQYI